MDKKVLGLKDFLKKAAENEEKKVRIAHIDVEGFGLIEFVRPREGVMIDYLEEITETVDITKEKTHEEENGKKKVSVVKENTKVKIRGLIEAAEKFVYLCCPMLQAKETLAEYSHVSPYEVPTAIFGHNLTIELAGKLNDKFDGSEARKKVKEEIKN
ncbi:MAG: hypothetical protein ACRCXX_09880 [Cetobacterium sp.]|uniref:hypothetical protein n=1 Tax=Cetobacterium sp. TaxID=2071632 RepID=UPI003F344FA0